MMRTHLRLAAVSVAAATLVVTAAEATAGPSGAAPVIAVAGETGSSALDSGSAAARSGAWFLQRGDVIGILTLLVAAPLQILTSGICDLATISALPNPCVSPTR
ncbi:hypothetical protein [Nocardia sp. CY41]|uniref:hypothetical protein n=1 Tax=Nocardia sp. CY41 TaxID=2608686 RepID=UPI001359C76B|nr:hypothetical protein [Nocardia sp. CY41]